MSSEGTSSSPTNNAHKPKSEFIKQETIHREKWLSLEKITYKDPRGKIRTWETVERTTKPQRPGVADGLVDSEETVAEAAIRELKEETGYVGTITSISPVTVMDSGMSASTLNLVFVQVDGDDTVNQRPVPNLDEGEFIEVIHAPLHELKQKLDAYSEAGDLVDSRVYTYAATLHQCQHKGEDMDLEQQKGLYKK
ncbi:ADP-sugar pyrophosphatase-like isoform X3 [Patiria miniata]|uniref:Nudix hydrolase domain-containing protein n=1 Tax=Patiria miniata TaxID=46514 RepID=A0A913ZR60_PATMI|nr:ADP-sugar pyrophosphatase-like isoform X3 [Patiria miniata]